MSPETASPVFPDRLIHPLPKRRLRERLSSDAAESIKYPPDQTPGAPLFYYPYSLKQDAAPVDRPVFVGQTKPATPVARPAPSVTTTPTPTAPSATADPAPSSSNVKQGAAAVRTTHLPSRPRRSSGDTETSPASRTTRVVNRSARPSSQPANMPRAQGYWTLPSSSTLSADGFDSFEYTSNTKKRKIPSAGDASHTGSYSSTSLRSTASETSTTNSSYDSLAGSPTLFADTKPAHFSSAPVGISGPGRGRYGRSQRYPLTASDTSANAGIISNAIANAERQGQQENADLASQLQDNDAYPQGSLQFTFTCSSKVPGNLLWSGSDARSPPSSAYWQQGQQNRHRGSQTASQGSGGHSASTNLSGSSAGGKAPKSVDGRSKQQIEKDKENYKLRQELRKQARDRRRYQQELNAMRTTPESDIYICPFCEFENITGHKPRLIYEFEMKERKKRLELERRQREQRNKEKARNRNRKGRKATKAAAAAAAAGSSNQQENLGDDQQYDDTPEDTGQGTADDDYEDDDGAGEADDYVAELRLGIGDAHNLRSRGRDGEGIPQLIPAGG